jgi:hypothetical protein
VVEAWYKALCIVADHGPMAYWHMPNGAEFWWTPGRSQLCPERLAAPFRCDDIVSVTVFDAVRVGREVLVCDWPSLRVRSLAVGGLWTTELRGVRCPPASPPNQALCLTMKACDDPVTDESHVVGGESLRSGCLSGPRWSRPSIF